MFLLVFSTINDNRDFSGGGVRNDVDGIDIFSVTTKYQVKKIILRKENKKTTGDKKNVVYEIQLDYSNRNERRRKHARKVIERGSNSTALMMKQESEGRKNYYVAIHQRRKDEMKAHSHQY